MYLNAPCDNGAFIIGKTDRWRALRKDGNGGDARVAAHNGTVHFAHIQAFRPGYEGVCSHRVQFGHAQQSTRVSYTAVLVEFICHGQDRIDLHVAFNFVTISTPIDKYMYILALILLRTNWTFTYMCMHMYIDTLRMENDFYEFSCNFYAIDQDRITFHYKNPYSNFTTTE